MMVMMIPPRFESPDSSMIVNIINDSLDEDDEDYGDGDGDDDYCYYYDEDGRRRQQQRDVGFLDPYEPGGAFNDPLFDAYYSSHFQIAR